MTAVLPARYPQRELTLSALSRNYPEVVGSPAGASLYRRRPSLAPEHLRARLVAQFRRAQAKGDRVAMIFLSQRLAAVR